jgi:hypothetical protein
VGGVAEVASSGVSNSPSPRKIRGERMEEEGKVGASVDEA